MNSHRNEDDTILSRHQWIKTFIGTNPSRLWCPPITHYTRNGVLDVARVRIQWRNLDRYVGGFLVPGSTGDGWEMNASERDSLIDSALNLAEENDTRILIGTLYPGITETVREIRRIIAKVRARFPSQDTAPALKKARIAGFTVCPPAGAELSQVQIKSALEQVLQLNVPIALYQLPQITGNEMSPGLVTNLAERYPNFILFKDSSGEDKVALTMRRESGILFLRGAEDAYAPCLQEMGGPYNGLLLSTANCFAKQYSVMLTSLETGDRTKALNISRHIEDVVKAVFTVVGSLPYGNPFSNANKVMDHWMAYGTNAHTIPMPLVHCGERLPVEYITNVGRILDKSGMIPAVGYMECP